MEDFEILVAEDKKFECQEKSLKKSFLTFSNGKYPDAGNTNWHSSRQ